MRFKGPAPFLSWATIGRILVITFVGEGALSVASAQQVPPPDTQEAPPKVDPQPVEWIGQYQITEGEGGQEIAIDSEGKSHLLSVNKSTIFYRQYPHLPVQRNPSSSNETDLGEGVVQMVAIVVTEGHYYLAYSKTTVPDVATGRTSKTITIEKRGPDHKPVWGFSFFDDRNMTATDLVVNSKGEVFVAGTFDRSAPGDVPGSEEAPEDGQSQEGVAERQQGIFVKKIDSSGKELFEKIVATEGNETIGGLTVDADDNFYIGGSTSGDLFGKSNGRDDFFLAKYDTNGKELWTEQFGANNIDQVKDIVVDQQGGVYMTGLTYQDVGSENENDYNLILRKYDSQKKVAWTQSYGADRGDSGEALAIDAKGDLYVGGTTYSDLTAENSGGADFFIAKYDSTTGGEYWIKQIGSSGDDLLRGLSVDTEGNLYFYGDSTEKIGNPIPSGGGSSGVLGTRFLGKIKKIQEPGIPWPTLIFVFSSGLFLCFLLYVNDRRKKRLKGK
ncbi:MAG: SBBP repeat-containing protein [Pirellulaceae bacterium]|nr:SBBP repeat-containing protein [Pirellulaceae bacterium]